MSCTKYFQIYNNLFFFSKHYILSRGCLTNLKIDFLEHSLYNLIFFVLPFIKNSWRIEHMIPEMAEQLKPELKHQIISSIWLYNLPSYRLLSLNRTMVLNYTGICSPGDKPWFDATCIFYLPDSKLFNGSRAMDINNIKSRNPEVYISNKIFFNKWPIIYTSCHKVI